MSKGNSEVNKSVRDGVGFAGVAVAVTRLAEGAGVDPVAAGALGMVAATVAASGYRWLRARWTWLSAFDPGAV